MHLDLDPALDGIEARLQQGARIADVGCGQGASTLLLAAAYPNSTIVGIDPHEASLEAARKTAAEQGLSNNVRFELGTAQDFGSRYDLVCFFDTLHDTGDPAGACEHVRSALEPGGALMIVEPNAGDDLAAKLNPVGAAYYAFSTMLCTPNSLSQDVGTALGAQAGEARLREVVAGAGFGSVRRVSETPFNIVLEARPKEPGHRDHPCGRWVGAAGARALPHEPGRVHHRHPAGRDGHLLVGHRPVRHRHVLPGLLAVLRVTRKAKQPPGPTGCGGWSADPALHAIDQRGTELA